MGGYIISKFLLSFMLFASCHILLYAGHNGKSLIHLIWVKTSLMLFKLLNQHRETSPDI